MSEFSALACTLMCRPYNLYPDFLDPYQAKWRPGHMSLGACGDSFYEYLLKEWIRTDRRDILSKVRIIFYRSC